MQLKQTQPHSHNRLLMVSLFYFFGHVKIWFSYFCLFFKPPPHVLRGFYSMSVTRDDIIKSRDLTMTVGALKKNEEGIESVGGFNVRRSLNLGCCKTIRFHYYYVKYSYHPPKLQNGRPAILRGSPSGGHRR